MPMLRGLCVGRLAQLVERYVHIVDVAGSSPAATTSDGEDTLRPDRLRDRGVSVEDLDRGARSRAPPARRRHVADVADLRN